MACEPPRSNASMASKIRSICHLVRRGQTLSLRGGEGRVDNISGFDSAGGLFVGITLCVTFILAMGKGASANAQGSMGTDRLPVLGDRDKGTS